MPSMPFIPSMDCLPFLVPKWTSFATSLGAQSGIGLTPIIYFGTDTGENIPLRAVKAIAIHSMAIVAYCCVFGLLSLLTKRVLIAGILYIIAVEGVRRPACASRPTTRGATTVSSAARVAGIAA